MVEDILIWRTYQILLAYIYLYLKKKNANKFDGLIGFNSKEDGNGLEFNGYLDLHLEISASTPVLIFSIEMFSLFPSKCK